MSDHKRQLTGLTLEELTALLESRSRALAALRWLYQVSPVPAALPERIPGVSPEAWANVRKACELSLPRTVMRRVSADGTLKYVFEAAGARFEAVLIPAEGRSTLCVSSQSGCTRHCAFCATARLGFGRNLHAGELVAQFLIAKGDAPAGSPLRNVVFMGMGEPFDNLDEVLRAIGILEQPPAPQLGASHITVSTSGVLPGMERFLRESESHLALSLNATTDAQRAELMPQTRQWPLAQLLELLRMSSAQSERLFFVEYVLLDGFNDSDDDARRLVALLKGVRARVNLIPHNGFEGCGYRPSRSERVLAFQRIVHESGIRCLLRSSRGDEIGAACGQLALRS
ncbi:MAG: 23S rRNA (adenine(2503)-C(2))-methyltransferase RlmN [Deltaproteobacteria bacterium]|nr:23S rRNA (adenine(2503)-C(2))-methyltransferase RlmN [Deltaproteobacteria bacterium]